MEKEHFSAEIRTILCLISSNFVRFPVFWYICSHKMFYKSAEKSYFYTISTPVNLNFSVEQYYTQHMHARAIYSFGAIWYEYSLLTPPLLSFFVCVFTLFVNKISLENGLKTCSPSFLNEESVFRC